MSKRVSTLIASTSSELRDALQALLETIAAIETIYQASNRESILEMLNGHHPTLVLIDFALLDVVALGNTNDLNLILIVLVDNRVEQARARFAGSQWVFMKGTAVSPLVAAIERLLAADE